MIVDPTPWRDELIRVADRLEAKTRQARWTNRTDFLIERDFIVSAYAMRWLIESGHVPEDASGRRVPVRRFDPIARLPLAPGDIGDSYDLENGRRTTLSAGDLCHAILNSASLTFCCGETNDLFDGVYVTADRERTHVYLVLASDFIALCEDIANSTITQWI